MNLPNKVEANILISLSNEERRVCVSGREEEIKQLQFQLGDSIGTVIDKYEAAESLLDDIHAQLFHQNCAYETAVYDLVRRKQLLESIASQFGESLRLYLDLRSRVLKVRDGDRF